MITLQIVPLDAGAHAAADGPFTILRFSGPDLPDIVCLEHLTNARYLDKNATPCTAAVVATLTKLHVRPNDRVLIMLPDGPGFAEAFSGAIQQGAVPLPASSGKFSCRQSRRQLRG